MRCIVSTSQYCCDATPCQNKLRKNDGSLVNEKMFTVSALSNLGAGGYEVRCLSWARILTISHHITVLLHCVAVYHRFQHASDAAYDKYRCPVFKGFVICVSGMASDDRNNVRAVVEQNGLCSVHKFTCSRIKLWIGLFDIRGILKYNRRYSYFPKTAHKTFTVKPIQSEGCQWNTKCTDVKDLLSPPSVNVVNIGGDYEIVSVLSYSSAILELIVISPYKALSRQCSVCKLQLLWWHYDDKLFPKLTANYWSDANLTLNATTAAGLL